MSNQKQKTLDQAPAAMEKNPSHHHNFGIAGGAAGGAVAGAVIGAIAGPVGMAVGIAAGALVGAGAGEAFHETDEEDKVHEAELDEATGAGSSAPTSGAEGPKPKTDA